MILDRKEVETCSPTLIIRQGAGDRLLMSLHFNVACESGRELLAITKNGRHFEKCVKDTTVSLDLLLRLFITLNRYLPSEPRFVFNL